MTIQKGDGFPIQTTDYDIRPNHEGKIKEVLSRGFGPIKYKATSIDSECGYVVGSTAEIYTQEFNKEDMLNILHVHINDMSDSVTLSVSYLLPGHSLKDFSHFGVDHAGQTLRYRVIVQD